MKKLRDLGSRENRNILKLEIDDIMADSVVEGNGQLPVLEILNSFSPRPFSFTVLIGKGSTDLFFGLLNSSDRSVEMPQGSS